MTETSVAPEPQMLDLPEGPCPQWLVDYVGHHNAGCELHRLARLERQFDPARALDLDVQAVDHFLTSLAVFFAHAGAFGE